MCIYIYIYIYIYVYTYTHHYVYMYIIIHARRDPEDLSLSVKDLAEIRFASFLMISRFDPIREDLIASRFGSIQFVKILIASRFGSLQFMNSLITRRCDLIRFVICSVLHGLSN